MNTDEYKTLSINDLIADCLKKKSFKFQLIASYLMDLRDIHNLSYKGTMYRCEIINRHLTAQEASSSRKKKRR